MIEKVIETTMSVVDSVFAVLDQPNKQSTTIKPPHVQAVEEIDKKYSTAMETKDRPKAIIKSNIEKIEIAIDRYNKGVESTFRFYPESIEKTKILRHGGIVKETLNYIWTQTNDGTFVRTNKIKHLIGYINRKQNAFINQKTADGANLGLLKILNAVKAMLYKISNTYNAESKKLDRLGK